MTARKPIINPKEAVQFIRMGFSDEGLMQKYGISAKGLESLFRKLIQTGELDPAELDNRLGMLDRSQSVVLACPPEQAASQTLINVREALEAIRSGMSDLELMRKFSISAKGVDKLFRKLILAGKLDLEELDRRAYASHMFQVAELDELQEPNVPKPRVKAAEAVRDIRADKSDAELMEKYGLSSKGLESLFRKLVKAGEIMQAELDQRLLGTASSHYIDLDILVQPSPAKCRVKAADALMDIRSGMTDVALMKKYSLSVRGLASLFRKLVLTGRIEQAELDRRTFISRESHFVDLAERPEPVVPKVRVKASELAACIRAGMDDAAIMEKFNVSAKGLGSLLRKLVAAGRIEQTELDARQNTKDAREVALAKDANGDETPSVIPFYEDEGEFELEVPSPHQGRFALLWQYHWAAILTGSALIILLVATFIMAYQGMLGKRLWKLSHLGKNVPTPDEILQKQVTELIAILDDIHHNPDRKVVLEGIPGAENLQECLEGCSRDHATSDGSELGLLLNCRRQCMAKHGTAIKEIRRRYYQDDGYD